MMVFPGFGVKPHNESSDEFNVKRVGTLGCVVMDALCEGFRAPGVLIR
jgi:hypothetical protein